MFELQSYADELRRRSYYHEKELSRLKEFTSMRLQVKKHSNGHNYYSVLDPGTGSYRYLGTEENENVAKIKIAHYLDRSLYETKRELLLVDKLLKNSRCTDYENINSLLAQAYRGARISHPGTASDTANEWLKTMNERKGMYPPFKPEGLIHSTNDGNKTRSKGEALIYNYLLDIGVSFIYELPLEIRFNNKDALLLPDFTILSEIDFKSIIYVEHQGMMNDYQYRSKFNDSVYKYWLNDLIPDRDVFFTFDLPNGAYDDTALRSIINRFVRPLLIS